MNINNFSYFSREPDSFLSKPTLAKPNRHEVNSYLYAVEPGTYVLFEDTQHDMINSVLQYLDDLECLKELQQFGPYPLDGIRENQTIDKEEDSLLDQLDQQPIAEAKLEVVELVDIPASHVEVNTQEADKVLEKAKKPFSFDFLIQDKATAHSENYRGAQDSRDPSGFAQDFCYLDWQPKEIGKSHVNKRLELFKEMCQYVHTHASHLRNYTFTFELVTNQFVAGGHYVPQTYIDNKKKKSIRYANSQRAHIGIINKLVVQIKDGSVVPQKLMGPLVFKGKNMNLHVLGNLCDIAHFTVNKIDGYMEKKLRVKAIAFLENVKDGEASPTSAVRMLACLYWNTLKQLRSQTSHQIFNDAKAVEYVDGMKEGANTYIDAIIKSTKHQQSN